MSYLFKALKFGFAFRIGVLFAAGSVALSSSAVAEETGKQIFEQKCVTCHSIGGGEKVGPDLSGVGDRRKEVWLLQFIKSSKTLISSGDKDAVALYEQYKKTNMPDHALSDNQIKKILAHIKDVGTSPAASKGTVMLAAAATTAAAAPLAAAAEPTAAEIKLGGDLYEGRVRFANNGPACNACHHVNNDAVIGGGVLAPELTSVFSKMGRENVRAIVGGSPFPVMQAAYEGGKALKDDEVQALVAFLQKADKEHAWQQPRDYGWGLFGAGTGGMLLLVGLVSMIGRRRKKTAVMHDMFERQVKSEPRE